MLPLLAFAAAALVMAAPRAHAAGRGDADGGAGGDPVGGAPQPEDVDHLDGIARQFDRPPRVDAPGGAVSLARNMCAVPVSSHRAATISRGSIARWESRCARHSASPTACLGWRLCSGRNCFLWQEWAVVKRGDPVQRAVERAARFGIRYRLELSDRGKGRAGDRDLPAHRRNSMVSHENVTTAFELPGYRVTKKPRRGARHHRALALAVRDHRGRACRRSSAATSRCSAICASRRAATHST